MNNRKPAGISRFYKTVGLEEHDAGFQLTLDGRSAKTPERNELNIPTKGLAQAIASEWQGQGETIDFASMPMTGYQMSVLDSQPGEYKAWADEIIRLLKSDLLCYRADGPDELVARQVKCWDLLLASLSTELDITLRCNTGIVFVDQPADDIDRAHSLVGCMDVNTLLVTRRITELTGSAALALLATARAIDVDSLVTAAQLDEVFQAEKWGADEEAEQRRSQIAKEIADALRYFDLVSASQASAINAEIAD